MICRCSGGNIDWLGGVRARLRWNEVGQSAPIMLAFRGSAPCPDDVRGKILPLGMRSAILILEPISKSSEEDNEAGELDKAEEVLSVVLPADEDATLPLYPGEEALDEPASRVTA